MREWSIVEKAPSDVRVENPEPGSRVVLKRYLAGIPYSHRRPLTPIERRWIWSKVLPYVCLGVGFILIGVLLLIWGVANKSPFLGLFAFLGLVYSAGLCAKWAWPFLQSLRAGVVDVYIGPLHRLDRFDAAHDYYLAEEEVSEYVQRYVELLAVGKGERIWRLEGVENDEKMAAVRSVYVATIPDVDEIGERPLTPQESEELRLRAREFRRTLPFLAGGTSLLSVLAMLLTVTQEIPRAGAVVWALVLAAAIVGLQPLIKRFRFGTILLRDRKQGTVTDGNLSSGLPWVVRGEPARWRIAQPKGGSYHGITVEAARGLEEGRA